MIFRRRRRLLERDDIPKMPPEVVDPSSVFNPGAIELTGTTHLLLRVQTRGRRTYLVPASSKDGRGFRVAQRPTNLLGLDTLADDDGLLLTYHVYDPRVTLLDNELMVVTAADTDRGCRLVIWRAAGDRDNDHAGLDTLDLVAVTGTHETRNGVLFPERIGGKYIMLERPNSTVIAGVATGDTIVLSTSEDLCRWETGPVVAAGHPHYWDELIGAGPPPQRTHHGWLQLYHGVATHFQATSVYQVGALLLAADDPAHVLARTTENIYEPREVWELAGHVPNVVFPSGLVVPGYGANDAAPDDALVRLYYGAADTLVGVCTTTIGELIAACTPVVS